MRRIATIFAGFCVCLGCGDDSSSQDMDAGNGHVHDAQMLEDSGSLDDASESDA